jgi:peptide/nickel transport system substrate-binding protein
LLAASSATVAAVATPVVAESRSTIRFVPQADLALLDPVFTTGLVTRNHGFLVYDQFYGLDENFDPQPQMVEGHVIEKDGKTWKLTLRDGMIFHDGAPVLARDAVASIDRWMKIDAFGKNLASVTDAMTAASDKVIQFRLKKPFPLLSTALAKPSSFCPVLPERLAKTPVNVQITHMTGSGPFRFIAAERLTGSLNAYERSPATCRGRAAGRASRRGRRSLMWTGWSGTRSRMRRPRQQRCNLARSTGGSSRSAT